MRAGVFVAHPSSTPGPAIVSDRCAGGSESRQTDEEKERGRERLMDRQTHTERMMKVCTDVLNRKGMTESDR